MKPTNFSRRIIDTTAQPKAAMLRAALQQRGLPAPSTPQ
jgi:hypothetical protein